MNGKLRVGLLFGGSSVEHEVSVASARGVASGLDSSRYECVPLAVTGEGRWLAPEASAEILDGSADRVGLPSGRDDGSRLVIDPGGAGILCLTPGADPAPVVVDVLFPVLHGWGGEDGRLQGALGLARIPCVGAGVLGSALGMDKEATKKIFEAHGLPVGPWRSLLEAEYRARPDRARELLAKDLGFPLFVKPANGGSSVGVSKVDEAGDLAEAIETALACDRKIVVEAGIAAREIECAVLGNDEPEASVPGEIVPSREFYDYAAKYLDGTSQLLIPAPVPPETRETVRALALRAFRALELAGMARIDFFLDRRTGDVWVNEANTLPGFTPISMFPKLWEATGVSYPDLLRRLIGLAIERATSEGSRIRQYSG